VIGNRSVCEGRPPASPFFCVSAQRQALVGCWTLLRKGLRQAFEQLVAWKELDQSGTRCCGRRCSTEATKACLMTS